MGLCIQTAGTHSKYQSKLSATEIISVDYPILINLRFNEIDLGYLENPNKCNSILALN